MSDNYYVDPEKLYSEIVAFQAKLKQAELEGKPEPVMNNYIGSAIISISTKFAYRPNFYNYSYRDEMISDGIEACIQGVKKIDTSKPGNPFIYLTKCCYYAFLLRIKKEKIQQYTRSEMIKEMSADTFNVQESDMDEDYKDEFMKFLDSNMNISGDFLIKKSKPKEKKFTDLSDFFDEFDDVEIPEELLE